MLPRPQAVETLLAAFDRHRRRRARRCRRSSRPASCPAAIEMMDALTIAAAEAAVHAGLPRTRARCCWSSWTARRSRSSGRSAASMRLCRAAGATRSARGRDEAERARIWKGRKAAFAAMGRYQPNYYVQDGVVPRTRLPEVLRRIRELSERVRAAGRQRVPRRRRQPAPAGAVRRVGARASRTRAEELAARDPAMRASRPAARSPASTAIGLRQGAATCRKMFSEADLDAMRPAALRRSIRTGAATRARCSRRRGCAARCPATTASTRWSGRGWRSGGDRARGGRPDLHGRGDRCRWWSCRRCWPAPARCWRWIRPATSG